MEGKVIKINVEKGYGFIAGEDKRDYFFHLRDLNRSGKAFRHIVNGDSVTFRPGEGKPNGCPRAFEVDCRVAVDVLANAIE